MRVAFRERWRVYQVWLGSGVSGILPDELRLTLGPVWALLPLARQVAVALGPWLGALLAARQRQGMAALTDVSERWLVQVLEEETQARPIEGQGTRSSAGARATNASESAGAQHPQALAAVGASWLKWMLEAELRRLVRLVEAPEDALWRQGWLAWEVRYWALAVCLARIGQLYAALEQRQEPGQALRLFKGALARVWQQALAAGQAA